MYKRPHHQRIERILQAFDPNALLNAQCFFGGGTAITLLLGEYRESVDIDFLCSSTEGYRYLRNAVTNNLNGLLLSPLKHLRDVRVDRDAIRTVIEIDGAPIKVELIKEGNSAITGEIHPQFGIPTLSQIDMFTQKIFANADRGMDKSTFSRDIIDLTMMVRHWGKIPDAAMAKAELAYGASAKKGLKNSIGLLGNDKYLIDCMTAMKMDDSLKKEIRQTLSSIVKTNPIPSL